MMLDVYICGHDDCHEFAVKSGQDPFYCPFCGSESIEFSHEVERGEW